jgi:hypothetical protein
MISSPYLAGRDRYQRVMQGWVDNAHDDGLTHTVQITDNDFAVEVRALCTPSPGYEVREVEARILDGPADPGIVEAFGKLSGARMVAGFTRQLTELAGARTGASLFVEAGVEVARLARQVIKLPPEALSGRERGNARTYWELDTTGWVDLPNSCFTYSAQGRALLGTRPVSTPMVPELYSPPAGARRIFVRNKLARLVLTGSRLHLFHSMYDNVHGFDIHYEMDLDTGTVVAADSITSRLPYSGLCTEPQGRIKAMIGERADGSLRKRSQVLLGGQSGCAQLYDLSADLLKLVTLDS